MLWITFERWLQHQKSWARKLRVLTVTVINTLKLELSIRCYFFTLLVTNLSSRKWQESTLHKAQNSLGEEA